ncbi:MAG: stage III sporulation AC/AD family protein [Oscillospiraceae bacterium]|nr:stage III sporulation AC/AD family protein [Oscillospiraceae bacterium]
MFKLVGAGITAAVAAVIVRQIKPEFAIFVQMGGMVVAALLLLSVAQELLAAVDSLLAFTQNGAGSFSMLAKALGIAISTQIAADLCRDSGSGALANLVELGGRLMILALTLPLLKSIAELAVGFIQG